MLYQSDVHTATEFSKIEELGETFSSWPTRKNAYFSLLGVPVCCKQMFVSAEVLCQVHFKNESTKAKRCASRRAVRTDHYLSNDALFER